MSSSPGDKGGRIIVVGAGVLGATVAFQLASRGADVTVLDAGNPGGAVSGASMAWLNAADKQPSRYSDLSRRSLDTWDRFSRGLGGDTQPTWGGELRWATSAEGGQKLDARARQHQRAGYPIRLIDEEEFRALEPGIEAVTFVAASYAAIEGHVDVQRVIDVCLERVRSAGGSVWTNSPVSDLRVHDSNGCQAVAAVVVGDDEIPCDILVIAAGAAADEVARYAGVSVPIKSSFGAVIVTEPMHRIFKTAALVQTPHDLKSRASLRQLPDGRVMIHGLASGVDGSLGRDEAEVADVVKTAARFVPALGDAVIADVRRGPRPIPSDGQPIIGFVPAVSNAYLTVMHNAITLAPAVSELAAIEILDGVDVDLLAPYRVSRFH
jgi:glycine/D-amino acid oxidase-like deaminating enzyme